MDVSHSQEIQSEVKIGLFFYSDISSRQTFWSCLRGVFFLSLFYCLQLSYSRLVVVKVIQCRAKRTGCPQYVQIWSHTPTLGKQMKHWHRARESLEFALQLHGSKCNGVCKREAKAKKRSLYFRWRQRRKCQIEKNIKKKIKCMGGHFKKAE